jgi:hypothetical protein
LPPAAPWGRWEGVAEKANQLAEIRPTRMA